MFGCHMMNKLCSVEIAYYVTSGVKSKDACYAWFWAVMEQWNDCFRDVLLIYSSCWKTKYAAQKSLLTENSHIE